jgi:branched-chain amino acid aminotransferase
MAERPYDRLDGVIWYDGKLVPWGDATLHVLSHGLHYASSVFEGERAYGGEIFKSTQHSERLKRSAQLLDFEIPYSVAEIDAAKRLVLEKNGQTDAYIRPVAWRGSEMMGVSAQTNKIHLAIATWQWPSYFDPVQRLKGIRLDLAEYRRPDPATAPARAKAAGLYMICTISKHKAERQGYADAMMLDWQGRVAECTGANIFFIKDGKIHTPIADCFLDGITRQTVIELARKRGIEVIEPNASSPAARRKSPRFRRLHSGGSRPARSPSNSWPTTPPRCSPRARKRRRNAAGKTNPNRARDPRSWPRPCARGARRGHRSRRSGQ